MKKVVLAVFAIVAIAVGNVTPVSAEYIPSDIAQHFADAVRGIIIDIVNFMTPILTMIGAGMVIFGAILLAARQEFYGIRLITGGVTLIFTHIVIPVILSLL